MTYLEAKTVLVGMDGGACPKMRWMEEWAMYYILQVAPGEEEKAEAHIEMILPGDLYGECFHLTRHMRKKFHGKWVDVREKLLPGYVFITAEDAMALFLELKKVPMLTNIVGRDGWSFTEMTDRDVEWLEKIRECGRQNAAGKGKEDSAAVLWYEVGLSQVSIDEGNQIKIASGPLKGISGMIKKIHLHKRIAEVEISFMKRKTVIYLGIELLEKR